jgi:hypothetical protein
MTANTSIRSSFLKSPLLPNVSGPVLGTPDYLSNYFSLFSLFLFYYSSIQGPEILTQEENHSM